jgi:hypothetical protein
MGPTGRWHLCFRDFVPGAVRFPMNFIDGALCCVAACAAATCRRTFVVFMLCLYVGGASKAVNGFEQQR